MTKSKRVYIIEEKTQGHFMLDLIRDLLASFRQTALERVKSPVLGAFVFSWLGFNWQLLILLARSKASIEATLAEINKTFGIESLLIGPMFTTALICFLLPRINKAVTKIQDGPNADTVVMSLESKIKIAELQQKIADIEARKKLAEKKEERYIEEGIHALQKENNELSEINNKLNENITEKNKKLNDISINLVKTESALHAETVRKNEVTSLLESQEKDNDDLREINSEQFKEIAMLRAENDFIKKSAAHESQSLIKSSQILSRTLSELKNIAKKYPELFIYYESDTFSGLVCDKNAESALIKLNNQLADAAKAQKAQSKY